MKTVKLGLLALTLSAAAYAAPAVHTKASISKTYPREYEQWENAMLAGDGKMGIMVFGDSVDEKIIVNDRIFNFPDHGTFCTDVAHAMQGIMLEMLVGSDETSIDLLPSLPDDFRKGSARGIETRCGVTVETLEWDLDSAISLTLVPRRDCRIILRAPSRKPQTLNLKKDVPSNISLKI